MLSRFFGSMPEPRSITAISTVIVHAARLHGDHAAGRAGLRGIDDQIGDDALHQLGVERHRRNVRRIIFVDGNVRRGVDFSRSNRSMARSSIAARSPCSSLQVLRAREIQETRDQRIGAVHFLLDVSRPFPGRWRFPWRRCAPAVRPRFSWCPSDCAARAPVRRLIVRAQPAAPTAAPVPRLLSNSDWPPPAARPRADIALLPRAWPWRADE